MDSIINSLPPELRYSFKMKFDSDSEIESFVSDVQSIINMGPPELLTDQTFYVSKKRKRLQNRNKIAY